MAPVSATHTYNQINGLSLPRFLLLINKYSYIFQDKTWNHFFFSINFSSLSVPPSLYFPVIPLFFVRFFLSLSLSISIYLFIYIYIFLSLSLSFSRFLFNLSLPLSFSRFLFNLSLPLSFFPSPSLLSRSCSFYVSLSLTLSIGMLSCRFGNGFLVLSLVSHLSVSLCLCLCFFCFLSHSLSDSPSISISVFFSSLSLCLSDSLPLSLSLSLYLRLFLSLYIYMISSLSLYLSVACLSLYYVQREGWIKSWDFQDSCFRRATRRLGKCVVAPSTSQF